MGGVIHGFTTKTTKHPLYSMLDGMKQRCYNPNYHQYKDYGGRGIIVCPEWKQSYPTFIYWGLENGWKEGLSIERIDNDGPYSPKNCRFATSSEQNRNYSRNVNITYKGEMKCVTDWAKDLGIKRSTLQARLEYGWSVEKAFTTPVQGRKK